MSAILPTPACAFVSLRAGRGRGGIQGREPRRQLLSTRTLSRTRASHFLRGGWTGSHTIIIGQRVREAVSAIRRFLARLGPRGLSENLDASQLPSRPRRRGLSWKVPAAAALFRGRAGRKKYHFLVTSRDSSFNIAHC